MTGITCGSDVSSTVLSCASRNGAAIWKDRTRVRSCGVCGTPCTRWSSGLAQMTRRTDLGCCQAVTRCAGRHRIIIEQIENAVSQHQPDGNLRVQAPKGRDQRHNVQAANDDGCGQDQFMPGRSKFACGQPLRCGTLIEDTPADGDKGMSRCRQVDLSAGPDQKTRTKMGFLIGDLSDDG